MAENNEFAWIDELFKTDEHFDSVDYDNESDQEETEVQSQPTVSTNMQVPTANQTTISSMVINKKYSPELNAALSAYMDYCGGPNHPRTIDVHAWVNIEQGLILAIKSNQKYSGFDLGTWEPWIYFGQTYLYESDTGYMMQKRFEKAATCIQDVYEDDDSIDCGLPGESFKDWAEQRGDEVDEYWYDTTIAVFPKNTKTVHIVSPDELPFGCYDVYLLIDLDTDNIIWAGTHSD